jgi:hypothetical protein
MARVSVSSVILHRLNTDFKGHSWSGLIRAAQSELERIERRAEQLQDAIELFKKNEREAVPFIGLKETPVSRAEKAELGVNVSPT